jgi:CheY-like chemotaxis protein
MSLKVLWVDDEPNSLSYEMRVCELQGWLITCQGNVADALDIARSETFDLVVTDLIMPNNSFEEQRKFETPTAGLDFIKALRTRPPGSGTPADVPILVITADFKGAQIARESGGVMCLVKPIWDEQEFVKIIENLTIHRKSG